MSLTEEQSKILSLIEGKNTPMMDLMEHHYQESMRNSLDKLLEQGGFGLTHKDVLLMPSNKVMGATSVIKAERYKHIREQGQPMHIKPEDLLFDFTMEIKHDINTNNFSIKFYIV